MIPPSSMTKTFLSKLMLIVIICFIRAVQAEDESSFEQRNLPGEIRQDVDRGKVNSFLYDLGSQEDEKLVTNSLVSETTIAPDFTPKEDDLLPDSKVKLEKTVDKFSSSSSNEENDSLKFSRVLDVNSTDQHNVKPNEEISPSQYELSSPPSFVPYPTGPDTYVMPAELESGSLTSEEVFGASSRDVDDASMYSTSSVFSHLAPNENIDEVPSSQEQYNSHESYSPRGKYNSHREENIYQRITQPSTEKSAEFKNRSVVVDISTQKSPLIKQKTGKTIKTYKSSADQVLRQFVENGYLRHPLACIVDTTESNLKKAQILWNATLRSNAPIDMVLSGYNSTGVAAIYSSKNTRTLLTGLNSLRESNRNEESGQAYTAILKTSVLIPYDSAIFLSTDDDPSDVKYFDQCATVMIKKRIRLYLIWFGDSSFEDNEASPNSRTGGRLGDLSLSTGGEVLHIPNEVFKNPDLGVITLFARTANQESDFDLVMDSTLSAYYTPRPIPSTPIQQESTATATIATTMVQQITTSDSSNNRGSENLIELFDYPVDESISNVMLDQQIADEPVPRLNVLDEQIDVLFPDNNHANESEVSRRMSRQSTALAELGTFIQPSLQSQLLVNPGSTARVIFDVTNLRDQIVLHYFQVTGERSWLINFGPRSAWIGPRQTIQVTVVAQVPPNIDVGTTDRITLTSQSYSIASQAVYLRVVTSGSLQDPHRPYLHYTYGARCDGKQDPGTCSTGYWNIEITTQDHQTGILRIDSEPPGLIIRTPFVAGTKEDVRASYSASCCQPRVTVTSYDVARNPSTFTVDVRNVWLDAAGIAAVVMGVLLGLMLLIFLILAIVWCVRRNRYSRELPVYRADSRTSHRR